MRICRRLFLIFAALTYCCGAESDSVVTDAQRLRLEFCDPNGRVMVVAHRGDWHNVPENSIPAIANCIKNGIDVVEVDVQKTKDGRLILMHDKTVDRTTDGNGVIAEMTLAEIKKLRLKDYNGKPTDIAVPTLEEAMLTVKDKCLINLDKADGIMPEAVEILKKTGTVEQAIFKGSKDPNLVNEIIASLDVPVIYVHIILVRGTVSPDAQQMLAAIDRFKVKPAAVELVFTDDRHPVVSRFFISEIKNRGIRVWINSLFRNDSGGHIDPKPDEKPVAWDWMLDRGVNVIQTNYPVRLRDYLQTKASSNFFQADINIIPFPNSVSQTSNGRFEFTADTAIVADSNLKLQAEQLSEYLNAAFGFSPAANEKSASGNKVVLKLNSELTALGDEGYRLRVDSNSILIEAVRPAGVFYGIQTLRQMLPAETFGKSPSKDVSKAVSCVEIEDSPRFGWRGLHLDVSRHFMPVEYIKKQLDLMALYKLNRFHWHLVDDQGWRIEIDRYPLLTKVGAWRDRTLIGQEGGKKYDNTRYGGFYTKEQIREVVKYAKERNIEVVPEIEMPGHSSAAVAAYSWLSCSGSESNVPCDWGIPNGVYCAGREESFDFIQNVLKEVIDLFPYEYIHIGGDEVRKNNWKQCEKCQARMKAEGLKDENELQSYFIGRIEKFLIANNRKLIGWDEILEGGLAPEATMMCWRDVKYALEAAKQGHDVIMSPTSYCYFDYYQANPAREPFAGSPSHFLPLEKVYSYNPASGFTDEQSRHILGLQANVWTEWIRTPQHAEYMTWPRACAIAEIGWTQNNNKDIKRFKAGLEKHKAILQQLDVNYFKQRDITKPKDVVRFMTYNILYGGQEKRGEDWYFRNRLMKYSISNGNRISSIIGIIKQINPDIVFLQECNGWADNDGKILKDVAGRLGMTGVIAPNHTRFKVVILSRFPMSNVHWLDDNIEFNHNTIFADIALENGKTITVASQHFGWWGDPKWKTYDANQQKQSYVNQYNSLARQLSENKDRQFVIAGDWNHTYEVSNFGQKPLYETITGMGYTDCCLKFYKSYERVVSSSDKIKERIGPIDFIFVSPSLSQSIVDADIVYSMDAFEASDHLPVWADISLKGVK